jgi:hypothetical protein
VNLQRGRFNQFERLTQKEYLKLDKANVSKGRAGGAPERTVAGPHALANPGGKIYRVLREEDMLTPEIIGRIFGIRRQPPPWSLPGVGNGPWRKWSRRLLRFTRRRFDSLAPCGTRGDRGRGP